MQEFGCEKEPKLWVFGRFSHFSHFDWVISQQIKQLPTFFFGNSSAMSPFSRKPRPDFNSESHTALLSNSCIYSEKPSFSHIISIVKVQ